MGTVEDLLKDTIRLPSPPAIAVRILDAVKKDNHSIGDLAAIIHSDPALTARILKVANSSLYSLPIKVGSIEKALPVLGMNSLKNIALSFVISNGMKGQGNGSFDFDFFWKRSITAAVAADLVATLVKHPDDDTFITALLQDIGIIVMHLCRPDDYLRVLQDKKTTGKSVEIVEKEVFGFDHQAVGAELLKLWGLPESITLPIRYHQRNEEGPDGCKVQASIVLLSDKISSVYHGTRGTEKMRDIKNVLHQDFNLDHPDVESLVDAVAHKSIEILSLFEVDPGEMKPFSQILQEANEELSSLNLSYERLVMELQAEVKERERAQTELQVLNQTLEQRVTERSAAAEQRAGELLRSEEALRTQTGILQCILNSMGDGVLVADTNGQFLLSNPAAEQILQTSVMSANMKSWSARFGLFLPDMETPYPIEQLPLSLAIRGEVVEETEVFIRHALKPDGGWISVTARPLQEEQGAVMGGVAVFRDVTDHKRAELELVKAKETAEEANRAKSAFLANMSHELRTPLNAIIGYCEILQEDAVEANVQGFLPDLQKIHTAGKHLLGLINDILDLSKIEAGRMELHIETFDLLHLIQETASTLRPMAEKNGNSLEIDGLENLGSVQADVTKVRQVLYNLVSNACKFTQKGKINLEGERWEAEGREWIQIRVQDTGIGLSPEQSAKLFKDFTQADASTTRKYGGTGLGLAISRRFCQLMGGNITVESRLGEGSVFTIHLPAVMESVETGSAQQADIASVAAAATGRNSQGRDTILVVDDDPIVWHLMSHYLAKEGFNVAVASSGKQGLEMAKELRPKLITLDVLMPEMDGWKTLTALKADGDLADIPVIMLTIVDNQNKGFALGASEYLEKPINRGCLMKILRKYGHTARVGQVLVVDDDPVNRAILRHHLSKEGQSVVEAENGRVALEQISKSRPDMVFLDLMMPEMDGFEFIARLRQTEGCNSIPVVVLTAKVLTDEDRVVLNGTVDHILEKNAAPLERLLLEVGSLINAHRLLVPTGQEVGPTV